MERRDYYFAREFLGLPRHGLGAHVIAEASEEWDHDRWMERITLIIGDSFHTVSFELSADPDLRENTFHVVDRLIEVLQGLRAAVDELTAEVDRRSS